MFGKGMIKDRSHPASPGTPGMIQAQDAEKADPESLKPLLGADTPPRPSDGPKFCGLPSFLFAGMCYCAARWRGMAWHGMARHGCMAP